MEVEKQKPWKISVQARAKRFRFKFKATKMESNWNWNLLRFSIFLRLHQFFLEMKSDSRASVHRKQPRTLKSKVHKFIQKLKTHPTRKRRTTISTERTLDLQFPESESTVDKQESFAVEEPICGGSLLVGTLAMLSNSISENDQRGIIIHGSSVLLFLALLCKKYLTGKVRIFLVFLTIAAVVCAVGFKYMNYFEGCVTELVWKAWNYAVSSGCLYVLSQVILSRICRSVGVGLEAK